MTGGTLLLSRDVKLHSHYKKRLEELGFNDVTVTAAEKDALNAVINEMKPDLVLVGFSFYDCVTPYMMSQLLRQFDDLNIAAVSTSRYPPDLAMYFIFNGVKSCVYYQDGVEQFYDGLECVRDGKIFISSSIKESMDMKGDRPDPAEPITPAQIEVIKLICNGYTTLEAGDVLHISERTVYNHKAKIYAALNVRNENELIRAALILDFVSVKELCFYGRDFSIKPKSDNTPKLLLVK